MLESASEGYKIEKWVVAQLSPELCCESDEGIFFSFLFSLLSFLAQNQQDLCANENMGINNVKNPPLVALPQNLVFPNPKWL